MSDAREKFRNLTVDITRRDWRAGVEQFLTQAKQIVEESTTEDTEEQAALRHAITTNY